MSGASPSSKNGVHILIFPFPAQGHMLPLLDLASQLAKHGLTITILVTPKNLPILSPLLSAQPTIKPLIFPFPPHPSVPSGAENVKDIGNSGNAPIIAALAKLHDEIVEWFNSQSCPPIALISDFFLGWTQDLANKIGVPRIVFYSSGAFLASAFDYIWKNFDLLRCLDEIEFSDFPRKPRFLKEHLPSVFRRYRDSDPDWVIVRKSMVANSSSWGAVINTFDAMESEFCEYFKRLMGHERVYSIGPVNLLSGADREGDPTSEVLSWLDQCVNRSVLYVCFGSQTVLSQAQIDSLCSALDGSGVKFVFVTKPITEQQKTEGYGSVPIEFDTRVNSRGLIIRGWAPQVSILSHRAVGGFLSHCGWNSVLEAVVGGVMILAWPMEADQYINARLLVDYMGAAVQVCGGRDTVPNSFELARTIFESMQGDIIQKAKANGLRDQALEAIRSGGSSANDMETLVREISE
uniref:Glycosyltransferase n=1 Tax=Arnebia euchroma TaxID=373122 RepID=A0A899JZ26_ARNEU|nr:glycosyltransferase [Arnebia euchroma]